MLTVELALSLSSLLSSSSLLYQALGILAYAILVVVLVSLFVYFFSWFERKLIAKIQGRHGPTFVGKFGLLQNLADLTKLLAKQNFVPKHADRLLFLLSLPLLLAFSLFLVLLIPLSPSLPISQFSNNMLLVFALISFMPLFVFVAGVASGNKFGAISAQRSVLMLLSYELPMFIVLSSLGLLAHSFSIAGIVSAQSKFWFIELAPIGFIVLFVVMLAELERPPFDLREADSELIAGWLTDVSAPYYTLALFLDYARLLLGSLLIALLFFGGWQGPLLPPIAWLLIKAVIIATFIIFVRATMMRMKIDRLLNFGWFVLLPASLINLCLVLILFG